MSTKGHAPDGAGGHSPPRKNAHRPQSRGRVDESSQRDYDGFGAGSPVGAATNRVPDFHAVFAYRSLPVDAQRALMMLWTRSDTPLIGIVADASAKIAGVLGITAARARSMVVALAEAGFIVACDEADLVWLTGFIENQLGGEPSASHAWMTNTVRALKRLPQTGLIDAFRQRYGLPADVPKATKQAATEAPDSGGGSGGGSGRVRGRVPEGACYPYGIGLGAEGVSSAGAAPDTDAAPDAAPELDAPLTSDTLRAVLAATGGRHG